MTFDLVVATVDRVDELDHLLESLEAQTHREFRLIVADQNGDARVADVLARHPSLRVELLQAPRGLSRARNAALGLLQADVVAFPDDDCIYPRDLLERVAARLAGLDGVTGREPWWTTQAAALTRDNLWNRAISFTLFLRRELVERVGPFDERLGLPSSSGEEIDYLIRALDCGARIEYDPTLVVEHPRKTHDPAAVGARDGASIGYLLRKHRYPPSAVARMLLRPAAGALRHPQNAAFHLATLRGRLGGYVR
ncbi:MAG TPA: glycosyltransferase family A protein [Gaiellaceae bacterium]|nr:glycosyltransferase family A protein [Gaiellaceae bacterium]